MTYQSNKQSRQTHNGSKDSAYEQSARVNAVQFVELQQQIDDPDVAKMLVEFFEESRNLQVTYFAVYLRAKSTVKRREARDANLRAVGAVAGKFVGQCKTMVNKTVQYLAVAVQKAKDHQAAASASGAKSQAEWPEIIDPVPPQ
jgi:hypothetical protein